MVSFRGYYQNRDLRRYYRAIVGVSGRFKGFIGANTLKDLNAKIKDYGLKPIGQAIMSRDPSNWYETYKGGKK